MTGSVLIVAYILLSLHLYSRNKYLMKNLIKYAEQSAPISKGVISAIFVLLILSLPLVNIINELTSLREKIVKSSVEEDPDFEGDFEDFTKRYYPERLCQMEDTSIVLAPEEISDMLKYIVVGLDSDFSELQVSRIQQMVEQLEEDDEENTTLYVEFQGCKKMLLVKARPEDEENVEILFFSQEKDLIESIDKQLDIFVKSDD